MQKNTKLSSVLQTSIPLKTTKHKWTETPIWYMMLQEERQVEIYVDLLLTFNLEPNRGEWTDLRAEVCLVS